MPAQRRRINATESVCTSCGEQFKVPMVALSRTIDAQNNLQGQFDRHTCTQGEANEAAV